MPRVDRKELNHPQISAPGEICSRAERTQSPTGKDSCTSCHSGHLVISYTSSKLLSLSDLGFFLPLLHRITEL